MLRRTAMPLHRWIWWMVVWSLGLLVAARGAPVNFNVPAQSAAAALVAFARQADVEVLFSFDDLKKVNATAVVGWHEPKDALDLLLRGTGFVATTTAPGKFVVARPQRATAHGEIRGSIVTADDRPLAAFVQVPNTTVGTRASEVGMFVLRDVPVSASTLIVRADGFVPARVEHVVVQAGRRTELPPVHLQPAGDGPQLLEEMVVNASDLAALGPPSVFALQEIIVSPSRFGLEMERGTIAATLTQNDLLALPQLGDDLYRAISHLPGLAADDTTARFWVRGAPHEQLLARLDGVDLLEPFHLKDTDGSLSILDLETISRLDLFTGGFTAEYGDRLAGVLTMETDSYARPAPRTTLGLSLTGGHAASRGQTASGRGRWLVSARSGYPDLALKSVDPGSNTEIRPRYYDLMGKWEFNLTPEHTFAVEALHAADRMYFRDSNGPVLTSRYGSDYLWARWRGIFGRVSGEGVLSYSSAYWRRDGSGRIDQTYLIAVRDRRALNQFGWRQDWAMDVSERALLRAGWEVKNGAADYHYNRAREWLVLRNGRFQTETVTSASTADVDGQNTSGYLAARLQPAPALTLEPGLRFDGDTYVRDAETTPRFNAAWHAGRTTWRAAWGVYAQTQGLHELAVADGDSAFHRAERAEHRVLSVEHRLNSAVSVRLEAYERIVTRPRPHWENAVDSISSVPEIENDRLRLDPVRQRAQGTELIVERRGQTVSWSASYSLARSEETLRDGLTIPRVRDQRHTFYLDTTYTPNPRWQFSVAWQYHSGWPITGLNFSLVPLAGGGSAVTSNLASLYALRLPNYQRLDLRAQRRFQLKHGTVRVYLDMFNALSRQNIIDYSYRINVGTAGQFTVERRNGNSLFPILPSVGATWDF